MTRKQKGMRILGYTAKIAWWSAVVLLAVLVVHILGAKLRGEVPRVFGYSVMNIVSGSMEDKIPEGSYILIRRVDASEVRKDDIICFISDDPAIRGYPNTHRVIKDPIQGPEGLEFVTQGDAASQADKTTAKEANLIGKYVRTMDGLTAFAHLLEGNGMITLMLILMVGTMVLVAAPMFLNLKKQSVEETEPSDRDSSDEKKT